MNLRSNQSNRVGAVVSLAALAFAVVPVSHAGSFTRAASKPAARFWSGVKRLHETAQASKESADEQPLNY
jgi:hypothetical protein